MTRRRVETILDEKSYQAFERERGNYSRSEFLREMIHYALVTTDEEIETVERACRREE